MKGMKSRWQRVSWQRIKKQRSRKPDLSFRAEPSCVGQSTDDRLVWLNMMMVYARARLHASHARARLRFTLCLYPLLHIRRVGLLGHIPSGNTRPGICTPLLIWHNTLHNDPRLIDQHQNDTDG